MKYKQALAERGLQLENVSKSIQKKVKDFSYLKQQIEELGSEENLDEEIKQRVVNLKKQLQEADEEIYLAILKFNVEAHQKRLEQLEELNQIKKMRRLAASETVEQMPVEPIEEQTVVETKPELPPVVPSVVETQQPEPQPQPQPQPEPQPQPQEIPYVEAEEFEPKATQKPKKGSLNIALFALGVFIAAVAGINMYKENRK